MRRAFLSGAIVASLVGWGAALAQAKPYDAKYDPGPVPGLCTHQTATVQVTVTNLGTLTWTADSPTNPNPFRLSYHWYQGGSPVTFEGVRTLLPRDIAPGQSVTLTASIQAPATSGSYTLRWDMVQENVTWFSWTGVPTADQTVGFLSNIVCLGGVSTLLPQITSTNTFISPGGVLLVAGHFFGNSGTLKLSMVVGPPAEIPLTVLVWQDTFIGAAMPDGISGVTDQGASVVVTRADAAQASHPLIFFATRDLHWLKSDDVTVTCSQGSWRNRCNGVGDEVLPCTVGFSIEGIGTLVASHQDANLLGDTSADEIDVDLKNGWALWDMTRLGDDGPVDGFEAGVAKSSIFAGWWTSGYFCDPVSYVVDLDAAGPVGVPFK